MKIQLTFTAHILPPLPELSLFLVPLISEQAMYSCVFLVCLFTDGHTQNIHSCRHVFRLFNSHTQKSADRTEGTP